MMHGRGVFTWADGRCYEGQYLNDKKHGRGKYTWPDGRMYDGQFAHGEMDGFGAYLSAEAGATERFGEWLKGKRIRWIERTSSSL